MSNFSRRSFVQTTIAATAVASCPIVFGQDAKKKVLYFSRSQGFEHGPVKVKDGGPSVSDKALQKVCDKLGLELECTKDGAVFDGDLSKYAAIIFYTSGDLDKPKNNDPVNDKPITAKGVENFLAAIKNGVGFIGFHSASDTWRSHGKPQWENQKPEEMHPYIRLVGGEFIVHGAQQDADVTVVQPAQFEWDKKQGEKFRHFEEWYAHKNFNPDMRVLLVQETAGMKTDGGNACYNRPAFPCVWVRTEGKGKVAYSAFGHNDKLWETDFMLGHCESLLNWVTTDKKIDMTPNINAATPGAFTLKN